MSNTVNNNNNSVIISTTDVDKLAMLKQFMQDNNIPPEIMKQIVKAPKEKFNYTDDTHEIAICNGCNKEFAIADIPEVFVDACKKQGICPDCAAIFAKVELLKTNLKNKNISTHGSKAVINGGKNVGQRLKNLFSDAIKSENFNEEILTKFMDTDYSNHVLKFSSYPFIVDITNVSETEQSENKNYYKRFYSKPYEIFGRKIKLCSQIFDKQLEACEAEFKKLGLVDEDAQY